MDDWVIHRVTLKPKYAEVIAHKSGRRVVLLYGYASGRLTSTLKAGGLTDPRIPPAELKALKPQILTAIAVKKMVL